MIMSYTETLDWLFSQLPAFERNGSADYKPGLERTLALLEAFRNPHHHFRSIHIAGTNGKGTTAHSLASVLQAAGMKVGLYTSPHIVDFRERIRVNGMMIPEQAVVDFVEQFRLMRVAGHPSFFELTTAMAFNWFAKAGVDIAVIETGLGGRLDSTNVVTPILSVITNISLDHTGLLGDTEAAIAAEKAGIIKPGVPCVVGRADNAEVRAVFEKAAHEKSSPLTILSQNPPRGDFEAENRATVLASLRALPFEVDDMAVQHGLNPKNLAATGWFGRWSVVGHDPLTIVDTGHNPGAWHELTKRLARYPARKHVVAGFVADKDVAAIVATMASIPNLRLYATAPSTPRALSAHDLAILAKDAHVDVAGEYAPAEALAAAREAASPSDTIFIGGSNYLAAMIVPLLQDEKPF